MVRRAVIAVGLCLMLSATTAYAQSERVVGEVLCPYAIWRAVQVIVDLCDVERLPIDDENDEALKILTDYLAANASAEFLAKDRADYEKLLAMSTDEIAELCVSEPNKLLIASRLTMPTGEMVPFARRITAHPAEPTYGDCV